MKRVVPFLKVDKGLSDEKDGVHLMKRMPELAALLNKAVAKRIFGTKMPSVINRANGAGIKAVGSPRFVFTFLTSTARYRSEMVQLVTLLEMIARFGTMTSAPSAVRMMQARIPMRRTSPTSVSICMRSPTLFGRSKSKINPQTELLMTVCSQNPMPTVNAPARIVTLAKSTPSAAKPTKKPKSRTA